MKAEEKTYNRLIRAIRNNPPVLDNSEALAADILRQIKQLPRKKKKQRKALLFTTWLSGIAAMLLFCLFTYETFFFHTRDVNRNHTATDETMLLSQKENVETGLSFPSDARLQEKKEFFLLVWQQKKEAKQKRYELINSLKQ
ncbi:hypothetical protein M2459_001593 [Parabacteroides sp. PF5-5]|uniref:hypothetical protein n=1 Tax=unclassified Parabacteroides TaxID=2649774 RepID=UPI0024765834|nr:MULTISPECIES: hypothetical protein [unclassified Parabacteroides]MDH6304855.1 hypothetical protein [Parabacteroides sp. PH5-39]MDH6316059.1 hypothetical protein [Parabacteroides sp. PF5-13]MDH6319716.1 hypothetical protein [Parabacteroides sp. PH5-13]MDH6323447.1 hypothetical protein [Parabacteroides sp. PH5-8]MDH6327045.1 hypothetical protein [Parabacteroides sp. PH5-41]